MKYSLPDYEKKLLKLLLIQLDRDNSNYQGTEEFVRVIQFSSYSGFRLSYKIARDQGICSSYPVFELNGGSSFPASTVSVI